MNPRCPNSPLVSPLECIDAIYNELTFCDLAPPDAAPARLTVRIDGPYLHRRTVRFAVGAMLAVTAAVGVGRLVGSRQTLARHSAQHDAEGELAKRVGVKPAQPAVTDIKRFVSSTPRPRRVAHTFRDAGALGSHHAEQREPGSQAGAPPPVVTPAPAAPLVAQRPGARARQPAQSQFSYLGQ
jgi:hypothetical protein